jgi:transcriptional regulator with XRE-family HTH domain
MPAKNPVVADLSADRLRALGEQIRAHRKALRNAVTAAEAAGMSRVTLHRIEHGEPSVTIGAYLNVMAALGLDLGILEPSQAAAPDTGGGHKGWVPARVHIANYPQLKQLAWHVHGTDELTPAEALSIYTRNWRHLDLAAMEPGERELVDALRLALGPMFT